LTTEATFDLLADAAGVRHPNPDRENRGLCPAHSDHNNPGLVFRISEDTGNLIVHCFAQHCSLDDLADSIGTSPSAFFKDGRASRFAIQPRVEWVEPSVLELLKLLPLGMSWGEQVEAVFRVLDSAYHSGIQDDDTLDIDQPLKEMPLVSRQAYLRLWLGDGFDGDNWHEVEDALLSKLMKLNRTHRTNKLSTGSAIPRRS
jgi:hypothetical protein